MRALSAAGGGKLDMGGRRVLITDPPLTVPSGVDLRGCHFEVHLERPGEGENWEASYKLPDTEGPGDVTVDEVRRSVLVQVDEGGTVGADGILLPDGGILAEVLPD